MTSNFTDQPSNHHDHQALSLTSININELLIASGVFLAALVVYAITLTPSLSYLSPDGSELATVPHVLGLAHSPGYPLYTWMGFLFSHLLPFGDVAHRINLMSAVLGAMGVGILYLITRQLLPTRKANPQQKERECQENRKSKFTRNGSLWLDRSIAVLCALLFAFSKDFWSQTGIAEVYAPNIALIALTLLALFLWERTHHLGAFFLFALLFGLSMGTHISNLGFAPALALFTLLTIIAFPKPPSNISRSTSTNLTSKTLYLVGSTIAGALGFLLGIAQFVWLPLKASTLNDRLMLRSAPTSWEGIYNYTLGAFPNFKFAFPLTALPDRLVVYINLLREQFGIPGIILGIIGLFVLLFRRPRHYFLLVGMYLVNIWFFIQYRAFDIEVFFIPAHFLWAIFIAFGIWGCFEGIRALKKKLIPNRNVSGSFTCVLFSVGLLSFSLIPLNLNWKSNDLSLDTAINDFYTNVWELLPANAALLTPGGVFGYDAFYWQLVYDIRPDVLLPTLPGPNPSPKDITGRKLYATTQAIQGNLGPGALPQNLVQPDWWQIPVLIGEQPGAQTGRRQPLFLYYLSTSPPELKITNPQPQIRLNADFGAAKLLGIDITPTEVESGGMIGLVLYWQLQAPQRLRLETSLSGQSLEQHELGFGLLNRYAQEVGLKMGEVIAERYYLVIPSTIPPGEHVLTLGVVGLEGESDQGLELGSLQVLNEAGTFEHWLKLAPLTR
ncbi:MAG: DUF2723 domain-containing protein [Chloroflexota bacterium]